MRCRRWLKAYGGTYNDYLDTPQGAVENLLRIDALYERSGQPTHNNTAPTEPGFPTIR